MAKPRKSRKNRPSQKRPFHTAIIVVVEGSVTEQQYFAEIKKNSKDRLSEKGYVFNLVKKKARESGIEQLIDKIKEETKKAKPQPYEAWIVCDNDGPAEDHKQKLKSWVSEGKGKGKHHVALSSPCFEYWLLLHCCDKSKTFCKGGDNKSIQKRLMEEGCDCLEGDGGKKHLKESFLAKVAEDYFIEAAISRAEVIPENATCRTDIHKLIRRLIAPAPPKA